MADNSIDFRLNLIDEMTHEVNRVERLTERSLKSMSKEQKKYHNKIFANKKSILKLERESITATKARQKEIRQEIALLKKKQQVQRQGLSIANRQNREPLDVNVASGGGMDIGALGGAFAAITAISGVINLGKEIFNITAEFEKYNAVLENTLGSQREAKKAMGEISQFASITPFSVGELTESFVKLANRGFRPTMEEMGNLGDLASSLGKPIDQLIEAMLDAQTGENERLKEFGIKAKKEGENTKFTFKGVTTVVKNSDETIRKYILSLGELKGVQGGMAKISQTLGGQWSNLKDKTTLLAKSVGDKTSGYVSSLLSAAGAAIDLINPQETLNELVVEEQRDLNLLVGQLMAAEEGTERRKDAIFQLNKEYPDILANIDAEIISNEELAAQMKIVNDLYDVKAKKAIQSQLKQDALTTLADKEIEQAKLFQAAIAQLQELKLEIIPGETVEDMFKRAAEDPKVVETFFGRSSLLGYATEAKNVANEIATQKKEIADADEIIKKTFGVQEKNAKTAVIKEQLERLTNKLFYETETKNESMGFLSEKFFTERLNKGKIPSALKNVKSISDTGLDVSVLDEDSINLLNSIINLNTKKTSQKTKKTKGDKTTKKDKKIKGRSSTTDASMTSRAVTQISLKIDKVVGINVEKLTGLSKNDLDSMSNEVKKILNKAILDTSIAGQFK